MFPRCPHCGCEVLDRGCGGWRVDLKPHDCLESLRAQETWVLEKLFVIQDTIAKVQAMGPIDVGDLK